MSCIVDGLEDPRDRLYDYIGITDDVYTRFNQHVTGASRNIEKNGWIWECRQNNIMILMRELERLESLDEGRIREPFWVAYYLNLGHPLHNQKIAKGLLKQKASSEYQYKQDQRKAEREAKRIEEPINVPNLEQAIAAYNAGNTTVHTLAQALDMTPWTVRPLYAQIKMQRTRPVSGHV